MESHKVGRLVLLRCDEAAHATYLVDRLQFTFKQDGCPAVVLGRDGLVSGAVCPAEYFIQLFRRHGLHTNDRQLVLSAEEQMVAMQLCLAEKNKKDTGDFDVEVSRVVEVNTRLMSVRLSGETLDSEFDQQVTTEYRQFMKSTNTVDLVDVLLRVKEECATNTALKQELNQAQFYVVSGFSDTVEREMLRFLAHDKEVLSAHMEVSLDMSLSDGISQDTEVVWSPCDLEQELRRQGTELPPSPGSSAPKSITECYVQQIIMSYLQLLVNLRSETALARVINVPDRGLDHRAFTAIKKEAKKTKLSMYQTASSYVMRLSLGGKSYAPDPESALAPYVKGISEFTHLVNKLQTIVEEDANTRSAIRRILNILRNVITKSQDSCLRRESVDAVTERLQARVMLMADNMSQILGDSPKRDVSIGGSTCGRANMKLVRTLLDQTAGQLFVGRTVDVLGDAVSSQKTPVRFPSLLSKFRSPLEHSPGCPESKSLVERMKEKVSKPKKYAVKRYQACLDWVPTGERFDEKETKQFTSVPHSLTSSRTLICDNSESSETDQVPHKRQKTKSDHILTESMYDQENIDAYQHSSSAKDTCEKNAVPSKRPLGIANSKEQSSQCTKTTSFPNPPVKKGKKATTTKTAVKKPNKKTNAPLLKGQKQMTAFFRL